MNEEEKMTSSAQEESSPDPAGQEKQPDEPKKKRKGRRYYLRDIHRGADGSFRYTGDCYEYDEKLNPRTAVLLHLWLPAIPAIIACIVSGCLNAPFMRDTWYVIAPFGFEVVSLASVIWAIGRITGNGSVMRSYVRKMTFGAIPVRCWFTIGFAAAGLIAAAVYMIVHGTAVVKLLETVDRTFACIAYLVCKAVNIACCILIMRFSRSVYWKETTKKV